MKHHLYKEIIISTSIPPSAFRSPGSPRSQLSLFFLDSWSEVHSLLFSLQYMSFAHISKQILAVRSVSSAAIWCLNYLRNILCSPSPLPQWLSSICLHISNDGAPYSIRQMVSNNKLLSQWSSENCLLCRGVWVSRYTIKLTSVYGGPPCLS